MTINVNPIPFLDATSTQWLERQLRQLETPAVKRIRPALTARRFFPVASGTNPLAASLAFAIANDSGEAKILANGSKDIPTLDVEAREMAYPVVSLAIQFGVENIDIQRAQALGLNLESDKPDLAYAAIDRKINSLAYFGSDEHNIPGLLNDAAIVAQSATHGAWTVDAPADILDDLSVAYSAHQDACSGAYPVTRVGMPLKYRNLLATTRVSTSSDTTILRWLTTQLEWLSDPAQIVGIPEFEGFGDESVDLCALISADPDCLSLKIPQDIDYTPPQPRFFGYDVACYARCGGLHIKRPSTVYLMKGLETSE